MRRPQPRNEVGACASAKHLPSEHIQVILKRPELLGHRRIVLGPVAHVLFRPEEVHACSPEGPVFRRSSDLAVRIADHAGRLHAEDLFVTHLDGERLAAVEAGRVHTNKFSRKVPADRQRFKSSLGKPALIAVHRNAVLRRHTVEWRERHDVVRPRMLPGRNA